MHALSCMYCLMAFVFHMAQPTGPKSFTGQLFMEFAGPFSGGGWGGSHKFFKIVK